MLKYLEIEDCRSKNEVIVVERCEFKDMHGVIKINILVPVNKYLVNVKSCNLIHS